MSQPRKATVRHNRAGSGTHVASAAPGALPDLGAFDLIGKGIFCLDLENGGRIVAAGSAGAAILALPVEGIVGLLPDEVFPSAVARLISVPPHPSASTARVAETPMPTTEQPERTIEWTLHSTARDGRLLGLLEAVDITPRKRTEDQLRKLSRAVEQSPTSVLITNVKGIIEYVNPRFTQISGYGTDEAIGKTPSLVKSGFTSPLLYREMWDTISNGREWQGEILNRRKSGELFWEHVSISPIRNEDGEITHFIAVKEDVTVRKDYEKRLLYQAHYDELTKLPNRILTTDRLSQSLARAERNHTCVGIAFIDLDGFKKVNDTLGHTYGDDLLRIAARRLVGCIRASDTVGRLGGDEFLVVLPDLTDATHATTVADKILKAFEEPFVILGHSISTTASIGLAIYPDDGDEAEILLRNADAAMYRAKDAGRNCRRRFHPDLNTLAMRHLRMESLLRGAIDRGEISVAYQPQIDVASGRLIGAEALARWRGSDLGDIPPFDFIPLAEDNGLIEPLGRLVLDSACRQMAAWLKELPPEARIAVNVSSRQVASERFVSDVAKALWDSGLPPQNLEIELTESLFALHSPAIVKTLARLRDMGVRLAVDDFGTGYSSLSYLREFPVDSVKIDRSFMIPLGDPAADALVRAIVAMGHSLGLQVIGEGVETMAQMNFLKRIGCDAAQGFLIDRPLDPETFLSFARAL